jgi:hypothetical protein
MNKEVKDKIRVEFTDENGQDLYFIYNTKKEVEALFKQLEEEFGHDYRECARITYLKVQ